MSSVVLAPKEISYNAGMFYFCKQGIFLPCAYNGVGVWVKCTLCLHSPTPCATSLSSLLLNTTHHSHLYIFIFCSLYKLLKKTCEVYSEVNVF